MKGEIEALQRIGFVGWEITGFGQGQLGFVEPYLESEMIPDGKRHGFGTEVSDFVGSNQNIIFQG